MLQLSRFFLPVRTSVTRRFATPLLLSACFLIAAPATMLAQATTTTTLAITPTTTNQPQFTVVTLSASVHIGTTTSITSGGTVNFFDSGILIGSGQIIKSGGNISKAILKFVPGAGSHSYTASFLGTTANAASTTSAAPKTITITTTGNAYKDSGVLSEAVNGHAHTITDTFTFLGATAPTVSVAFRDTNGTNLSVASTGPFTRALVPQATATAVDSPLVVAAGDFNEDGYPDLVYTSSPSSGASSSSVSVSLNNKTGGFSAPSAALPVGNFPLTLAVGDFNNDGHLDLAVANLGDGTVSILLGVGNGTFATALTPASVGLDPFTLAVGDFNNDGKLDLATANLGSHSATILLGAGDGTFTTGTTLNVGQAPDAVAIADFDKNGTADLAVANLNDGTVSIFFGNNTGTAFTAGPVLSAGSFPAALVVADFNGDTFPDIAVVNQNTTGTVTILSGASGGAFSTTATLDVGDEPYGIVAGNLLGAGHIDLAVSNAGNISILPGQSGGTFAGQQLLNSDFFGTVTSLAGADFNGDGSLDLVAPNYDQANANLIAGAVVGTVVTRSYTPSGNNGSTHAIRATPSISGGYAGIAASTITIHK